MTAWYWSTNSNDQSLGPGMCCSGRLLSGTGARCGLVRLIDGPCSCRCRRALFPEEVAEHRVDLRGLGGLAHREVRVTLGELRVFLPQILLLLCHLDISEVT